ncbi:MAG: carbohydrate ABC transporter permease [Candidatus Vecturithrix sp.]|jgi:raffinose/stachyose/melibiose transport system permease protein|nr:carbohydrate ABC transporter permease [Candidatus Vecturithrix sp.]
MAKEYNIGRISLSARIIAYIVMIAFTVLTIGPLCWLLYSSVKPHAEITRNPLALPTEISFENFKKAWIDGQLAIAAVNSVIYTGVATTVTVILAVAAGYGFAKFSYRIAGFFYMFFILGLLVTVHSVLVPMFIMETKIGIDNTRFGVIVPYIAFGLPFAVYLATSYIKGIPDALIEVARIDGANYLEIFWHVILPISKPIVTTMIIFTFLSNWNEFVLVFTLTSKPFLRSLPVGINAFAGGLVIDFGLRFASLSIGTVPMVVFYLIFRNQIEHGFAGAAVKE